MRTFSCAVKLWDQIEPQAFDEQTQYWTFFVFLASNNDISKFSARFW